MEKAQFQVRFSKGKFSREGNENGPVYISTKPVRTLNPSKLRPGGELSRLMLAIKSAFSRKEGKTSIVFDERVDTGVSGSCGPRQLLKRFIRLASMVRFLLSLTYLK